MWILEGFLEEVGFKRSQSFAMCMVQKNIPACAKMGKGWNFKWGGAESTYGHLHFEHGISDCWSLSTL